MLESVKEYPNFDEDYMSTMGFIDTRLDVEFSGRLHFISLAPLIYSGTSLYCCTSTMNGEEWYFVVPVCNIANKVVVPLVRRYPTHCGAKRHTHLVIEEFIYSVACTLGKPYEEVIDKYYKDLVKTSPAFDRV